MTDTSPLLRLARSLLVGGLFLSQLGGGVIADDASKGLPPVVHFPATPGIFAQCPTFAVDTTGGVIVMFPVDYSWGRYAELFAQRVNSTWFDYLRAAKEKTLFGAGANGAASRSISSCTVVGFSILKNGKIDDARILQKSGPPGFGDVSLEMVKSLRLLPLPKSYPDDHAYVTIQFLVGAKSTADFRSKIKNPEFGLVRWTPPEKQR